MTGTVAELEEGASCRPNISPAGRRMRRRFGVTWMALSAASLGAAVVLSAPWYLRAAVFVPVTLSAFGFLQARRNTCVARAREGTFEQDDFSKTTAAAGDAAASRRVARGITRDAVLLGLLVATAAAATAYVD